MGDGAAVLEPCSSCTRHVRTSEARCPFCGAPLEGTTPLPEPMPAERLSRNQIFSFRALVGAGLLGTSGVIVACEFANVQPLYGAPCSPPVCGPQGGTSSTGGAAGSGGRSATGGASEMGGDSGVAGAGGEGGG